MKTIFWAVDCQKDFIDAEGALCVKDAWTIRPMLKEITEYARANGIKVVNTADCHTDKSKEISKTPDFKTTFPPHCMIGKGKGIDFIDETYPKTFKDNYSMVCYTDKELHHTFNRARNIIIYKDAFDVFAGNHLTNKVIEKLAPEITVVYGVATNICVHFAVLGLRERGIKVFVVKNAIKELPFGNIEDIYNKWRIAGALLLEWKYIRTIIERSK